ncbi:SDR family NAD(P)-dependent oxidoreductase [Nocardioides marmotae]|uniref:SDR family NAD(P)-dependent oxidoreductase n=1 Tax=Nocardioides marmotae TaxID=2663857 RepID=UPI001CA8CECD|nr:SDR family oxidoreductase [Nocardioides marmotae]
MPFDLTGRAALVTGGNSGIGAGMARALAAAGSAVAIWGRNPNTLEQTRAELAATGVPVLAAAVDVSDRTAVLTAFDAVVAEWGRVDTVVANAGVPGGVPFVDLEEEGYRAVLDVNLDGVVWTLQAASRHMVERAGRGDAGGSLVVVSSLSALEGAPRAQAYAASKGAVLALTRGLAVELARYGVRANAVVPGWIQTPMTAAGHENPRFVEKVMPRIPARRWGEPADFGGLAVYLASDASAYHTGDELVVDGGYAVF